MKDKFMKNGVFSLEYDKETLRDMVLELQEENKQLKERIKANTILVKDEYGDYQECNINPLGMKQKYEKQVDNWNKLKEWVNKHYDYYMNEEDYIGGRLCFTDMKSKMHELERSNNRREDTILEQRQEISDLKEIYNFDK